MNRLILSSVVLATLTGYAIPACNGENAPMLARKVVTEKVMPDSLVASDGTRCTTKAGKFRKTDLKSDAWCIWLVPAAPGTAAAARR